MKPLALLVVLTFLPFASFAEDYESLEAIAEVWPFAITEKNTLDLGKLNDSFEKMANELDEEQRRLRHFYRWVGTTPNGTLVEVAIQEALRPHREELTRKQVAAKFLKRAIEHYGTNPQKALEGVVRRSLSVESTAGRDELMARVHSAENELRERFEQSFKAVQFHYKEEARHEIFANSFPNPADVVKKAEGGTDPRFGSFLLLVALIETERRWAGVASRIASQSASNRSPGLARPRTGSTHH